ncbi:helicase associated domain-containing protein [Kitasatospora purpeofusca]|uniref:helicase associated domain-containing protein n=1 Tax=Kitasatospora purpeofusca TaxID=67352 RepID=UPI00386EF640|nr:helicase associated domain-containing protein [Kitasatospora purpeofusca]
MAAPARASVGGYAIGTWLAELRAAAQVPAGEQGALAAERRAALEEIDPWWCPVWPVTWQRTYATARLWWLDTDGLVNWTRLPADTVFEGEQLGRWVQAQRAGWPGLEADQRDLLTAIGIEADPELVAAKAAAEAKPKTSRADRFQQGLGALAAFVEREGHARVPRSHREDGTALGAWVNNQKARRDKLTGEQRRQLAALGVEWAGVSPTGAQPVASRSAGGGPARPAPTRRRREHHDECDGELYEGGTCTCDLIAELGAPSDREDPYWDNM